MMILVLARQPDVEPDSAISNNLLRLIIGNPIEHRLIEQFLEVFFAKPHHRTVRGHCDCCVSLGVGDQSFLAESVADYELR